MWVENSKSHTLSLNITKGQFQLFEFRTFLTSGLFDVFAILWWMWMPHQVFPAVISLTSEAVCPLPVLVHVLVPLLLPCSLRGALLCNARCIRCIFIPHYFTPQRPLLETGDAAIRKKGLTLCCVTLWAVLSNFLSGRALMNSPDAQQRKCSQNV